MIENPLQVENSLEALFLDNIKQLFSTDEALLICVNLVKFPMEPIGEKKINGKLLDDIPIPKSNLRTLLIVSAKLENRMYMIRRYVFLSFF